MYKIEMDEIFLVDNELLFNKRKVIAIVGILLVSIVLVFCFISFEIGTGGLAFTTAIGGVAFGTMVSGISLTLKFSKTLGLVKGWRNYFIVITIILLLVIVSAWHSSIHLYQDGIERTGTIIKIDTVYSYSNVSDVSGTITEYYYSIDNWKYKILVDRGETVGSKFNYLYSKYLPNAYPIISYGPNNRFKTIINEQGWVLIGTLITAVFLLSTWFSVLMKKGQILLSQKLSTVNGFAKELYYKSFFYLSYLSYIIFVLALFKNSYSNIPFQFWSILFTTLVAMIILITDWGERLFVFSTNIALELKSYKLQNIVNQILKLVGYLTFILVLLKSLLFHQLSVPELLLEGIEKFFDIDFKSFFD